MSEINFFYIVFSVRSRSFHDFVSIILLIAFTEVCGYDRDMGVLDQTPNKKYARKLYRFAIDTERG